MLKIINNPLIRLLKKILPRQSQTLANNKPKKQTKLYLDRDVNILDCTVMT